MSLDNSDHAGPDSSQSIVTALRPAAESIVTDYELNLFRNASLADIQFLFNFIDRAVLDRVIDELMNANRVFVIGSGENYPNASFMGYLGSDNFGTWYTITGSKLAWETLLPELTNRDVVFAISTSPSSDQNPFKDDTIQVAKRARDRGATVVAIVDQAKTALTTIAEHVLYVRAYSGVLRSHIVTAILLETIVGVTVLRSEI